MSLHQQITSIGPGGVATFGDGRTIVHFFAGKKRLGDPFVPADGPIQYAPCDMVRVFIPGEKDSAEYEAFPRYQHRWPQEWARYKEGKTARETGTPLDMWLPDDPAFVATMLALHIETVEQLAGLHDTAVNNIDRGMTMRQSARKFLGMDKEAEVQTLKAQNQELLDRLAALEMKVTGEVTPPKRGPGRPPKSSYAQEAPDGTAGL